MNYNERLPKLSIRYNRIRRNTEYLISPKWINQFSREAHSLQCADKMADSKQSPSTQSRASNEGGRSGVEPVALLENEARRLVEAFLKIRQHRKRHIAEGLVEDAALMMIFELYLSHVDRYELTVTGLCDATDAPPTTALRRIDIICNLGLAAKREDANDSRRVIVTLTAKGLETVNAFLSDIRNTLLHALCVDPRTG